jgi:DNA replication and repair protein RecF
VHVERIALEQFRNYEKQSVELSPQLNLVIGRNAQGKTNLLEAAYCLSGLGSPRSPDSALIKEGSERAVIHGDVVRGERKVRVDIEFRQARGTRALLNGSPLPRLRSLGEILVCVFFGPDELSLVKGSPDGRRRFLDEMVVKLRPAREKLRREWERVLKQRNSLLKAIRRGEPGARAGLEVWDDSLCIAGAALASARLQALAALVPHARKRYEEVAGGGTLELSYESSWMGEELAREALTMPPDEETLRGALRARLRVLAIAESERGITLAGPHRDDVVVRLTSRDGGASLMDARTYSSQGEQRTSALGLKLGEHDLLSEALGHQPVLLLDDVFSELDPYRRTWLAEAVRGLGQTILSTAEPGAVEAATPDRVLRVDSGTVVEDG